MGFGEKYGSKDIDYIPKLKEEKETKVYFKKTSEVISDPINGFTNPKRIPGAIIRFKYEIKNNLSKTLNNMFITEQFDLNIFQIIKNKNFDINDTGYIKSKNIVLKPGEKIIFSIDCILK